MVERAKLAEEATYRMAGGLCTFLEEVPDAAGGLVVYRGSRIARLAEDIVAVPWTLLAGAAAGLAVPVHDR